MGAESPVEARVLGRSLWEIGSEGSSPKRSILSSSIAN